MKRLLTALLGLAAVSLSAQDASPDISDVNLDIVGLSVTVDGEGYRAVGGLAYLKVDLGRAWDGTPLAEPDTVWLPKAEASIGYRAQWDKTTLVVGPALTYYGEPRSTFGALPDRYGNVYGEARVVLQGDTRDETKVPSGTVWELGLRWGPRFLALQPTDFYGASASVSTFSPLWSAAGFDGVLAVRAGASYVGGEVPLLLLEPTEVRGYTALYDTRFRSVVSGELRTFGPEIPGVRPVLSVFADAGWHADYAYGPSFRGLLASAGVGLGLQILGAVTPTFYAARPLTQTDTLWWGLTFNGAF